MTIFKYAAVVALVATPLVAAAPASPAPSLLSRAKAAVHPAKPATAAAPAKPAASPAGNQQRSAISIACSKQADAKGLHGKPRQAFRDKCMHPGK